MKKSTLMIVEEIFADMSFLETVKERNRELDFLFVKNRDLYEWARSFHENDKFIKSDLSLSFPENMSSIGFRVLEAVIRDRISVKLSFLEASSDKNVDKMKIKRFQESIDQLRQIN